MLSAYCPPCMSFPARAVQFKRIVGVIKALRGEIYGKSVRDMISVDLPYSNKNQYVMDSIKCRFADMKSVYTLISILRVDYTVLDDSDDGIFIVQLKPNSSIRLETTTILRNMWRLDRPSFDVDGLASNNTSMFVYTLPTPFDPADNMTVILSRILNQKFSLAVIDATNKRTAVTVVEAIRMVQSGWTMDNKMLGPRSWIASTWKNLVEMKSDECSICQERFGPADIVIALPCSHVFHGFCDKTQKGGICRWLQDNSSCPCCRRNVCGHRLEPAV